MWVHPAVGEERVGDVRVTSAEHQVDSRRVLLDQPLAADAFEDSPTSFDEVVQADAGTERLILGVGGHEPSQLAAPQIVELATSRKDSEGVPAGLRQELDVLLEGPLEAAGTAMFHQEPFGERGEVVGDVLVRHMPAHVVHVVHPAVDDAVADGFCDGLEELLDFEDFRGVQRVTKVEHVVEQRGATAGDQVLHRAERPPHPTVAQVGAMQVQVVADLLEVLAKVHARFHVARRWPHAVDVVRILDAEPRR